jgi:hypothetical protein
VDLARPHVEIDIVEGDDTGKDLADAGHFEDWSGV